MALLFSEKMPSTHELQRVILDKETEINQYKEVLSGLDFEDGWEILRTTLAKLDRLRARDLVRLLLSDKRELLLERLSDRNEKGTVLECLSYLPGKESVKILTGHLSNADDKIQLVAAGALKNHTPRLVVPVLIEGLLAGNVLPARAGEVLLSMDYLGQEGLLEAYDTATPEVKSQILELLIQGENPKCQPFLPEALKDNHPVLREKALEGVMFFQCRDLWPEVVECLLDPAWAIRAKSIQVLESLGVPEAREYVELFKDDEDQWVQECARNALESLL